MDEMRGEEGIEQRWNWVDRQAVLVLVVPENGFGKFAKLDLEPSS